MARKWSNLNIPGALHFVTGNFLNRAPLFRDSACCGAFLQVLSDLNQQWPSKLIAFVLMPDHFRLIRNPRDGRIKEFIGTLKSLSAKHILTMRKSVRVRLGGQVWQESFKAMPLWSGWMIWQKVNYIHANPVKAGIVKSAKDYPWSSPNLEIFRGRRDVRGLTADWVPSLVSVSREKSPNLITRSDSGFLPNLSVVSFLSEDNADTDTEVVLRLSTQAGRIVIELNGAEINTPVNAKIESAADDSGKARI